MLLYRHWVVHVVADLEVDYVLNYPLLGGSSRPRRPSWRILLMTHNIHTVHSQTIVLPGRLLVDFISVIIVHVVVAN